jgi:hypothetical protein
MPNPHLLSDIQVFDFIINGYHLVTLPQPKSFHDEIYKQCSAIERNPGNAIYDLVPGLKEIYSSPQLTGALQSILGDDCAMNPHRHLHTIKAKTPWSQNWHQDGTNVRNRQVWTCLAMYYPQDVSLDMGPTAILPGSHLRNAPTDRMSNYTNIKGTMYLAVPAGTVAITHYDLWHAGTLNRSDKDRHMLKFLFDRQSAPVKPSWNHEPEKLSQFAQGKVGVTVGAPNSYTSDHYKEYELRKEMWLWLCGQDTFVPPGHFRNMLNDNCLNPTRSQVFAG